jgi:hypothetical protein
MTKISKRALRAQRLLRESIPERLAELHGCARIIEAFEGQAKRGGSASIRLKGRTIKCTPARTIVLWPFLDTAIITSRVLLNLLGIGINKSGTGLVAHPKPKEDTDAWMGDFNLRPIGIDEACKNHADLAKPEAQKLLILTLNAANKGIGHLTDKSTRDMISRKNVARACDIVIQLVNRHVYEAKSLPLISFGPNSKHGHVAVHSH